MATNKKSKSALPMIIMSISVIAVAVSFTLSTVIRHVDNHDSNLKQWVRILATSCNLFSVKNNRFPASMDEINQGYGPLSADVKSNVSYFLKGDKSDGVITADLYFGKKYTVTCTQEKFPD